MAPTHSTAERAVASAQKVLTLAASLAASAMVARAFVNDFVPYEIQDYVHSALSAFFSRRRRTDSDDLTLVIEEPSRYSVNEAYDAAEAYVAGLVSPSTTRMRVRKTSDDDAVVVTVDSSEEVVDVFDGVAFRWRFVSSSGKSESSDGGREETARYELTFDRRYRELALGEYLAHVLGRWEAAKTDDRALELHILGRYGNSWHAVTLDHPATFETVAMDPELKREVVADLERFVRRREYYRRVGKAWKRGYLLYGPPGTGKSSLVAAIANYLRFDVYDLDLADVNDNTSLRDLLLETRNRSILVVEDVDCSVKLPNREEAEQQQDGGGVTLAGVLNMLDGVWSSCGDERIVVLTTNHPERLDPALLRPGRMDMHVHMSYCTSGGFRTLARNYHEVEEHPRMPEIERMLDEEVDVTAAEITGELMKSEDADEAFRILTAFVEEKRKDPRRRKGRTAEADEGGSSGVESEREEGVHGV